MEKKEIGFVESSHPILEIAYKPSQTVRYVLEKKSLKYAIGIAIVGGFSSTLSGYIGTKYNYSFTFMDILISSFSIGAVVTLLSILLLAIILTYAGRFLKGKGTFKEMLKGVCLTLIPYIWILPFLLFWMQFAPQSFFVLPGVDNVLFDVILQFFGSFFLLVVAQFLGPFRHRQELQEIVL